MEGLAFICPMCEGKDFQLKQETQVIPYFGEVMLTTDICSDCGYRHSDVMALEEKAPRRFTYRLSDKDGLNLRVIRSGTSSVRIDEIGVNIDPGSASSGYVTNIEGLINRIGAIIRQVERDLGSTGDFERLEKAREIQERIARALEGTFALTIVLEDPKGNGAIIGDGVREEDLTDDEVRSPDMPF